MLTYYWVIKMNVYDFDDTIYRGDSTSDFIKWCVKKKPSLALHHTKTGICFCAYKAKLVDKTYFKEKMYGFLQHIPDIDEWVEEFWDQHIRNIKSWYLNHKKPDDVIISASPEFLLKPVCECLGIKNLMASKVDKHTGFYLGINCFGAKKVHRFMEIFNDNIDEFYSDSLSDAPLAKLAEKAYLVKDDILIPWKV